ncbi:polyphosphate kinase [Natronoarchaeum philippinense]|uniref:Polyphosphate kinase n=1 Tax=Natronoarchaeum philippinense TaxID=558529 RepID=A0A285NXK5_NATPI|nr:polyphosphate kinase 1 [Natronoarchaeum philippinense]SNZ12381.1 polyphosphate kinase [Natronoarchaeum philippinense]
MAPDQSSADGSVADADAEDAPDDGVAAEPEDAQQFAPPPRNVDVDIDVGDDAAASPGSGDDSASDDGPAVDLDDPEYYLNRELSELEFQQRVLHEALDDRNPLLERVKFLSIVTENLDEFFRKRVGGLKQQVAADVTDRTADGRTPGEQWTEVLEASRPLLERQSECYREEIRPALADEGIEILDIEDLSPGERTQLREYFERSILPALTPLTFDPAHPFPFISNQSLSLAVLTRESPDADVTFSRVKIPRNQLRFIDVDELVDGDAGGETQRFVLLEELVRNNLDLLFPEVEIVDDALFRVTRNAEVRRDEEVAEDLLEMAEEVIEERRFATVVRLEIESDVPAAILDILREQLDLEAREVFEIDGPLDFRDFGTLLDLDRPDLSVDRWTPQPHPRLDDPATDIFEEIRRDDVLVHHPYHSFTGTVQQFLEAAAEDPDVLAIKASIYRTASDSQVIQTLIDAARNGKQVAVMVELKARFDEKNNLEWAKRLEEEGIHVAYGTIGYKTHTKTSLVVRREDDGVRLYSHVGTGNYHSETAKQYEDLGLLTADRDVGHDLVRLFNYFTGHARHEDYRTMLVAPGNMRRQFTDLIRAEAAAARNGEDARIVAKMNRLEDPEIVRELYAASMAGVDIELIVRDICRLRPGVEGVSDRIDVYSVVGRFLEHSRIFRFENGGDPRFFVGSADWMTRNLDNRVETIVPIEDPALQAELSTVLELLLDDNRRRWVMHSDGRYEQLVPGDDQSRSTHQRLMERARSGRHCARRVSSDGGDES